jgi:hypothetical protein
MSNPIINLNLIDENRIAGHLNLKQFQEDVVSVEMGDNHQIATHSVKRNLSLTYILLLWVVCVAVVAALVYFQDRSAAIASTCITSVLIASVITILAALMYYAMNLVYRSSKALQSCSKDPVDVICDQGLA